MSLNTLFNYHVTFLLALGRGNAAGGKRDGMALWIGDWSKLGDGVRLKYIEMASRMKTLIESGEWHILPHAIEFTRKYKFELLREELVQNRR